MKDVGISMTKTYLSGMDERMCLNLPTLFVPFFLPLSRKLGV